MGIYFKTVILQEDGTTPDAWMDAMDYNLGLKLTEQSGANSPLVKALETMLVPGGKFYRKPIVWAGQSALCGEYVETDEFCNWEHTTVYERCTNPAFYVDEPPPVAPEFKFLVNYTKKSYVDVTECAQYHPLPLLTREGECELVSKNCAGDFRLVGSWARDFIGLEKRLPSIGYEKIDFNVKEITRIPM